MSCEQPLDSISSGHIITKTCLYNFDPLKPHFYIVKLGFTGVYIIFLISAKNIDYGYSLELPRWGGSNEYPYSMFRAEIGKCQNFLSENFTFLDVKFSIYFWIGMFALWDCMASLWWHIHHKHFFSFFKQPQKNRHQDWLVAKRCFIKKKLLTGETN